MYLDSSLRQWLAVTVVAALRNTVLSLDKKEESRRELEKHSTNTGHWGTGESDGLDATVARRNYTATEGCRGC